MTILSTFGGASGTYTGDIGHSLRCRSGASAYLSRAFGTPTSQTRGLISLWYKPGWLLGGPCNAVFLATANPTTSGLIIGGTGAFGSTYENRLFIRNGGATKDYWNLVFRDPTSWYHIVVSFDTTQGTQADRAKCWVNGVEQTKGGSSLGASEAIGFLASGTQTINGNTASYYGDQYLARFVLMDGQCVQQSTASVSSFGHQNTEINEWVSKSQSAVKAVVDAGGTNSFMLDFDDGTSLTTLGYDKSSKGNNWTLNNFSLTAGTSYDHMLDVPGNTFATWNRLMFRYSVGHSTYSNGNLKVTNPSGVASTYEWGTMFVSSGQWYWEVLVDAIGGAVNLIGVDSGLSQQTVFTDAVTYASNGQKYIANGNYAYGASYTNGDIIGVLLDKDANTVTFYKNGVSQGAISLPTTYVPMTFTSNLGSSSGAHTINTGQCPFQTGATYYPSAGGYFRYAPPTGYKALCQRNMPDPAILNPELHMDVVTRTGTAATYSVAGLGFQPDLVWVKSRGRAVDHALYDSVRGVQKQLESNQTGVETTESTGLTAFNSGGYTGGALDQINGTTATNSFVDWLWKAGGAAVTNNAGSISSQVSANVTAGFSIVTYTGTGANATVGHGLGVAPAFTIIKDRDTATNWFAWHKMLNGGAPTNYVLLLNLTNAQGVDGTYYNSAMPNSTTLPIGTNAAVNSNTKHYVAYCFAEIAGYSNIFSYTGNGSADGPFVHCGFKPKYVLIKRVDAAAAWCVIDGVRNPSNVENLRLYPSAAAAEETNTYLDATSNGFKVRVDSAEPTMNASGGTYIGIAFADVPAKYSLAR